MSNNIVKHDQLKDIAGDLWTKAKKRDIERFEFDSTTKTLKGKNLVDTTLSIDVALTDLVSINDRAEFKKDVSVDDAKTVSNSNIGSINGPVAAGSRTTGYRGLTSKLFTDGYVKLLRIYLPENASGTINAHVWMIKKGALRTEDKLLEPKIHQPLQVLSSGEKKYIDVEIERKFEEETFFVLRTEREQQIQGVNNIKPKFTEDIINVNASFNPSSINENANWNRYNPIYDSVGHMELHGRTGIVDISKRLEEIAMGNGTVKTVNNIAPGANGNVVINADNIKYANGSNKDVKQVLDEKVSNIVLKATDKKKLTVTKADNTTSDVDLTEAFKANNVAYGKQIAGANKATVEDAIDALVAENGKSVKTIKNGAPDAQGNIDVTVAEGGTEGIKVTFGTGGTAVKIATYMTAEEVTAIKNLFV